ncbi:MULTISPECIES: TetR/AcrR family transcriptional regulator [Pseudomonas]|jgi:AcrR family transcriptional regulator|uniref:TetR/AcrR family transcriptional regulator n=1 Tax=Pseudomonas chlororaphis TaxID=587753 RepID=A0AB34C3X3_9PSED|nr:MULTISPECIES: TetR/AcrR family transcriptional regulator [Pseudomonas]AUG03714.1 TetR/AcrR family transcriptional regulator [Pseudomonas sp. 09C 129]EJK99470.1 transcriptional regulator, TetR family [Pseudomonas chlororaphis subsp. aureofaciens 30-84]PMY69808.1 TetR/AcrR family transcriptional regulator [Pseudomonas sp. FW126-L8]SEL37298.1 transcriptional regulator, TetR family [Pseudomonas sp. NFACC41-3]SFP18977.1 transcriptional regulator, TetR family [Pseudomonas sp. NFPP07]SMH51334.1 t
MNDSKMLPAKNPRSPKQTRGHERVTAILDACAHLLVSQGVASLTMHGLAREAGTSIGSLYHFFSDKQSVLDALGQRHIDAFEQITANLLAIDPATWVESSSQEVIDRMIMPIMEYLETHPDLLQMISPTFTPCQLQAPTIQARIQETYDRMLALRLPTASAAERDAYVTAMRGLPIGLFQVALENSQLKSILLLQEVPRAMKAYLEAIERHHAAR